jgi:serine protease Do
VNYIPAARVRRIFILKKEITPVIRLILASVLCLSVVGAGGLIAGRVALYGNTQEAAPKELTTYRDVVKRVLPAVVSIEAKGKPRTASAKLPPGQLPPSFNMPGLPEELRKELEKFQREQPPAPDMGPGRAFGSGFVVDPKGVILTNDHVVRNADEVEVRFEDGRKFVSKDIKKDPKTDLAIVRIESKEPLPYLKLADSSTAEIGDRVLAVGAPLGLTGTVTSGIISAKGRDIHMNAYEDFIQTDAAINPGNSGGPLVNMDGEVVGINSVIKSGTGGFQGIGLAISSNMVKNVMEQLLQNGTVHRAYLGVQVNALDPEVADRLGVAGKSGVVIGKVMSGAPGAKAGLKDGDVVTEIGGKVVKDPRSLQSLVAGLPIGKSVEMVVYRDGARKVLNVTVEEQSESYGLANDASDNANTALGKIGMHVTELTAEKAKLLGYQEKSEGVLIAEVEPNGLAGGAGLRSGMLIVKVDQQAVKTVEEVQKAVEKGSLDKGMLFQVRTPRGGTSYVLLKAPAAH